jgi:hypothetical protein
MRASAPVVPELAARAPAVASAAATLVVPGSVARVSAAVELVPAWAAVWAAVWVVASAAASAAA